MISDVIFTSLKKVVTPRGHLMEVQRAGDPEYPGFGQAYVTMTHAGVIKAWYRHRRQVDQIALVKGSLLLVLFDAREDSPTYRKLSEINVSEDDPQMIQIPAGIWHGFRAVGAGELYLLHLNSTPWDPLSIDEDRLASDDPSIPYLWAP